MTGKTVSSGLFDMGIVIKIYVVYAKEIDLIGPGRDGRLRPSLLCFHPTSARRQYIRLFVDPMIGESAWMP
jgi:hypothetical protein